MNKVIYKAYKFALFPTKEQQTALDIGFGCCRFVYNLCLEKRIHKYKVEKTSCTFYDQCKELAVIKSDQKFEWLRKANAQSLQASIRNLDRAFSNFYKGKAKFPTFKSKRHKMSFTVPQYVRVVDNKVCFPKFTKGICFKKHRPLDGLVKSATITRTQTGKYFVSILCVVDYTPSSSTGRQCGVDVGIKNIIATSDGVTITNPHYRKTYNKKLAKAQRHLSKKKIGSRRYENQARKVSILHEKVANQRRDFLHKLSASLVKDYDVLCIEDLNLRGILKNRRLSASIADVGIYAFTQYLSYKAEWNGKILVKIGRFFPSSKTCHKCGHVNRNLKLSDRLWKCPNGHLLDRDTNAAINILNEGLKIIGAELSDNTCGASSDFQYPKGSICVETGSFPKYGNSSPCGKVLHKK
jgi:putative transposase